MTFSNRLRLYGQLLARSLRILRGQSYQHVLQGVGAHFEPGALRGYYSDLRHKTDWRGYVDTDGFPVNRQLDGQDVYLATTVLQKGLGHWDLWIERGEGTHRRSFLEVADWALATQDAEGGWSLPPAWRAIMASPVSGMVQGEGASLLVRAYALTDRRRYLEAARKALRLMCRPVEEGGSAREVPGGLVFEELPCRPANTILNGTIFSLYGLSDFLLVEEDAPARRALGEGVAGVEALLPRFDAGYWSYYDLSGSIASPFYQHLHAAQLQALARSFPERSGFAEWSDRFERQLRSPVGKARAVGRKVLQKLAHPPAHLVQ